MDKFTELVGTEITARFLKPPQETQEVLQRVVHLLDEVLDINMPPEGYKSNLVVFSHKVRGVQDRVIALLEKSRQRLIVPWVGLTEDEKFEMAAAQYGWEDLLIAAEAKLKERNT